jgi:hypothetical protein
VGNRPARHRHIRRTQLNPPQFPLQGIPLQNQSSDRRSESQVRPPISPSSASSRAPTNQPVRSSSCATSSFSRLMFLNSATALALTFGRLPPAAGRVEVGVDQDLLLRQIGDQHVVAVVETVDVIEFDRLVAVADRVLIREALHRQLAGACGGERPGRQPVGLERRTGQLGAGPSVMGHKPTWPHSSMELPSCAWRLTFRVSSADAWGTTAGIVKLLLRWRRILPGAVGGLIRARPDRQKLPLLRDTIQAEP